jgi:hypothetical protein
MFLAGIGWGLSEMAVFAARLCHGIRQKEEEKKEKGGRAAALPERLPNGHGAYGKLKGLTPFFPLFLFLLGSGP